MITINQFIAEKLLETNIFEIARSLDDYHQLIDSMIEPLISYIILIMKARKENSEEFVDHWKKEIQVFLSKFIGIHLKTKNSYEYRLKHIKQIFYNKYELDTDEKDILGIIRRKLFLEGYDVEDIDVHDDFIDIVKEFQSEYLDLLIDVIASDSTTKIKDFINKL